MLALCYIVDYDFDSVRDLFDFDCFSICVFLLTMILSMEIVGRVLRNLFGFDWCLYCVFFFVNFESS